MSQRGRIVAGVLGAVVVLVLLERLIVTEAERVDRLMDSLSEALSAESRASMEGLLTPGFTFRGPKPIGEGDRERCLERLEELWERTEGIRLVERHREIEVSGQVAVIRVRATLRFRYDGTLYPHRLIFEVEVVAGKDGWAVSGLSVQELERGIL